jgi:hypothetical protein
MPRFVIRLPDPARARGPEPALAFRAQGADAFAAELEAALRGDALFEAWRARQDEPDEVDPALGATDPAARVSGRQRDLVIDLEADTVLAGGVLRHRLGLLAGHGWELRDVR